MIKVAIQLVLVYGCATINLNPGAMKTLEKTQGRLVKSALRLPKYYRNTPLLKALGIRTIRQVVNNNQLSSLCEMHCGIPPEQGTFICVC